MTPLSVFTGIVSFPNDLRHVARALLRNPRFSAIAVATLAFGIGADTAIFSVVDGILIRSLDYAGQMVRAFVRSAIHACH
jgi:putative ABC transport system permease protein